MPRIYCTYFDSNYLIKGLALIRSLVQHEVVDFKIFVIALDDVTHGFLANLRDPKIVSIKLSLIEEHDAKLLSAKSTRTMVEYYWTLTPAIILYLLKTYPEIEAVTYLDGDLFFFSSPQPIFDEFAAGSILIHEHRYSQSLAHLEPGNGRFNVGLLCFRNDNNGLSALEWWREQCIEWCYHRSEDGKMGDQMYLNDWPSRFPGTVVLRNIGAGVAPWNHERYHFRRGAGASILVDETPLVFYHFQSFTFVSPDVVLPAKHTDYPLTKTLLLLCFIPYLNALAAARQIVLRFFPEFTAGLFNKNALTSDHTALCRQELIPLLKNSGVVFKQEPVLLDAEWMCVVSSQLKDRDCPKHLPKLIQPNTAVTTEDDLLFQLAKLPICTEIQALYVIGAHLFQERELFDRIFPNLKAIYLFEPIPELFTKLELSLRSDSRIRVFPYAIADCNTTTTFHLTNNQASSSLMNLGTHKELFPHVHEVGDIPVVCRTIDSVITEYNLLQPDIFFIDVQGAEFRVLSSLTNSLRERVRIIYTEASTEAVYADARPLEDICSLLSPDFHFLGFAPLTNATPSHGNALFVNQRDVGSISAIAPCFDVECKVSAIVSTYSSEQFIRGCLEDLTSQTLYGKGQLEIIVVDSGSPQNEGAVVREFQQNHPNIKYIRTERETLYAAWNRGIREASGKYLTNANTDDRHRYDALETMSTWLDEHPDIDLVYGDCYVSTTPNETFDENAKTHIYRYPTFSPPDSLLHYQFGPQPMWRKQVHEKIGFFDGNFKAAGDYDFNIRFALKCKALHIPHPLGLYLEHGDALSFKDNTAVLENYRIKDKYRTPDCIEMLYRQAGFPADTNEEKANIYLDMGIKSLEFYPPWSLGKAEIDIDFARQCHQKAGTLLPVWPPQPDMRSSSLNATTHSLFNTFAGKFAAASRNVTGIRSDNLKNETKPNTRQIFPFSAQAHKYCVGKGLEIGGSAHNPFGLNTRNVDFCDSMDTIYKLEEVRLCGKAMPVDIVAFGDTIPLPDESQDFVVSSHVLEHFPNPIKALKEWYRLVKPGGIIFMIVPHKERTFDKVQPRTTLQHLVQDYYNDATEPHENPQGHDHCWITEDIVELVNWMTTHLGIRWRLVEVQDVDDKVGNGFTIVLKKDDALPLPAEDRPAASGLAPKSVLYVVHGFPPAAVGGVEVYTRNLAREMLSRGVRVTVLYPVVDPQKPLYSFATTNVEGLIAVSFNVQQGNFATSVVSPDIDAAFAGFLREHAFDVVHFHHVFENQALSMISVAQKAGLPVALTLHDFWFICPRAQLFIEETDSVCTGPETPAKCAICIHKIGRYHTVEQALVEEAVAFRLAYVRNLLKEVDLLLAPSRFVIDTFQRYGFGDGGIVLSPLGIVTPPTSNPKPSDTLRFGFLGTIHPVKNIMRLVAAFSATRGNASLHIYGGGEQFRVEALEDSINDPRIFYHGAYASEQLPEVLATIDALIVPSRIESYCLTVREAISAGLPVLASNVGGIPEIVSHGRNGILFDPMQIEELRGLLQSIIDAPRILQGLTATPSAVQTIQHDASSLLDRYRSMLGREDKAQCHGLELETSKPGRQPDDRFLKIAVFSLDYPEHACGYYRLYSPLKALSKSVSFGWGIRFQGNKAQLQPEVTLAADIIVIQRFFPCAETQGLIAQLLALNKPIIYEVDDYLTKIPDSNPNHAAGKPNAGYILDLVRRCTAVSVSTEELKRHFEQYNENIFILPNLLDDGLWQIPSPDSGGRPLVISYTGTITHAADIALLEDVLERISAAYPGEVSFTFMGCATERLSRLPGFTYIPFETTYETYARKLQQIPVDIALVPLEESPFNRCKSNIKWLEYSACGIAGIYADLPPYNTTIEHGTTGLLAGSNPDQWFSAIDLLIKNPELRRSIAANARRKVLSEYTLKTGAPRWLEVYRQVIAAHEGVPGGDVSGAGATDREAAVTPESLPLVSIIIPLFNQVDFTRRCLEALAQTAGTSIPHEIILVDNGSTDATGEYLRSVGNNVSVIRNSSNQGFARACNQGARAAVGTYLLFLNNDTVPQQGWLDPLIKVLENDPSVAAVGSKLLYPDGTIQHAGVVMVDNRAGNDPLCGEHIWRGRPADLPEANQPYRYQALTAACLLIRRTAFEAVRGFDEEYWNGYEDVDLCFKLGQQGWKLVYQPQSVVIHHESKSGPERFSRVSGNIKLLHRTWLGRITPDMMILANGRVEQTGSAIGPYVSEGAQPAPSVSIVIPLYNQAQLTKACVEAVRATAGDPKRYELILVDNGSWDWTRDYVKSLGDSVVVITNSDNLGFARACNQGAQAAQGRYLLFLNNDTAPRAGWLDALLAGADEDGADIVGGKLLYPNGRVQHAGVAFNKNGIGYHIFRNFPADAPAVNKKRLMQCVTAACMLVSRQFFLELGGFDEHYRNGFEDVDFCLRAGQAGRRVLYTPHAVVVHHEEQSEGRKQYDAQNMQRYLARWREKVCCDDEKLYSAEGFSVQWHDDGSCTIRQRCGEAERAAGGYPLVPMVGSYAETPLARISASARMKAVLKAYSSAAGTGVPTL